jgi:hypothetical protein
MFNLKRERQTNKHGNRETDTQKGYFLKSDLYYVWHIDRQTYGKKDKYRVVETEKQRDREKKNHRARERQKETKRYIEIDK